MRHFPAIPRTAVALAAVATLGAAGAQQQAFARATHATNAGCAAVGVYIVGQPLRSIQPERPHTGAYRATSARAQGAAAFVAVGLPRGTLDVLAYAPCGQPTRGTFSVQFGLVSPLSNQGQGYAFPTRAQARSETLSGTFSTGSSSAVSATVTVKGVLTVQIAQPDEHVVMTRTAFDVTGSLDLSSDDRTATLTLTRTSGALPAGMVIFGHRGSSQPVTE